jgi:3-oxoadipate enol-lactonase
MISYKVLGSFKKEPLLMLCGLGMPMSGWGATPKRFAEDFTIIMWDYPGLGKSSKLAHGYTTLDLAHDSAALLDYLGIRHAHVIGYSMGGIVAQQLAIAHKGLVKKIAFLASTPISDSMSWINPAAQAEMVEVANNKPAKLIRVLIKYAFNKPINRRVYGFLSWLYSATTDPDVLKKMFNASTSQETWSQLPTLSAEKAFALNGTEDHIINSDAGAALALRIPNCTADLIVEGSHSLLQEFRKATENKLRTFFVS